MDIADKNIVIIGAKKSGLSIAKLVKRLKGRPFVSENQPFDTLDDQAITWLKDETIDFECNGHTKSFIQKGELMVLSPGVRSDAEVISWARECQMPVLGEIEFAYQFCSKPVIAVTGSNGKTTVVTLIDKLLKKSGLQSCLCGNVGFVYSDYVLEMTNVDYVVLELSSFQIEMFHDQGRMDRQIILSENLQIKGFKPFIAVLLNFSQNHLDRHKDMEDYFAAKTRIFLNQDKNDFAVLNYRDERIRSLAATIKAQTAFFNQTEIDIDEKSVNPNYSAVMAVAKILGIKQEMCEEVFTEFKGVEHRLELVRTIDGIDFVNDSKATTAEAARWAIERIEKPIIMICGGKDKNLDFSVIANHLEEKVKKLIVFGEAKEKIAQTFNNLTSVEVCDSLNDAVSQARKSAQSGDCVVLSPMCASFDMFSNFEERGKIFKKIVNKIS